MGSAARERQLLAKVELHKARAQFWKKYAVIFAADCGAGWLPGNRYTRGSVVAAIKRMAASDGDACPETEREGAAEHEGGSEKDGTSLPS